MTEFKTKEIIATDYGIEENQAKDLMSNLPQLKAEREAFLPQYNDILKMDINSPETSKAARELRLLIVKNRTQGISVWHKKAKDYFLKGGQFVDAIKRKEIAVNELMESNLKQIEDHFENLEKERIANIQKEREEEFFKYEFDGSNVDLGRMDESTYKRLLLGAKTEFEEKQRIAAEEERKRIELEKKQKAYKTRKESLLQFAPFHHSDCLGIETTNDEYIEIYEAAKTKKEEYDQEQAKIKAENERLKKEAEAKKLQEEKERTEREYAEAKAKAEQEKKEAELKARAEAERKAREAAEAKIKAEQEAKKAAEKAEAERLRQIALQGDRAILKEWISAIMIPSTIHGNIKPESEAVRKDIVQKFNAFKNWANKQIDSIE